MNIFSGHDTSLLALSTALNVDIGIPPFSACIMVELHATSKNDSNNNNKNPRKTNQNSNNQKIMRSKNRSNSTLDYNVQIYYRNTHTNNVTPLKLPGCAAVCPLEDFLRITSARTTGDRGALCGGGGGFLDDKNTVVAVLAVLSVAVVVLLVVVVVGLVKRSIDYRYQLL